MSEADRMAGRWPLRCAQGDSLGAPGNSLGAQADSLGAQGGSLGTQGNNGLVASELQRYEFVDAHMATLCRIVLYAASPAAAEASAEAAFAQIALMERVFSDYDPASEARRLTTQPPGRPVRVSRELFAVLARGQAIAEASAGAFDMTIGPAVALWRHARWAGVLPMRAERTQALARAGHRLLTLSPSRRTVALGTWGMQLDFGGIAKGAAADAALAELARWGISQALVAAGGDLAIGDPPPGVDGWSVAVEELSGLTTGFPRGRLWANCGISTSGGEHQHIELGGVHYSHIVDPRTGIGVTGDRRVTVRTATAADSDALATAICVMGGRESRSLLAAFPGTDAWISDLSP